MPPVFQEHPLRHAVTAELHARTFEPLHAPERVSYLAVICGEQGADRQVEHLKRLLAHYGQAIPETFGHHYWLDLGPLRVRWERHTEFVTYTFSKQGAYAHPFAEPVLHELPAEWLRELPGEVIVAVAMAIDACAMPERGNGELTALFDGHPVIGSEAELTYLAAEIEEVSARTTYRFDASRAYYDMVRQRLEQLRQQRIEGLQTFTEFLDARLAPGIAIGIAVPLVVGLAWLGLRSVKKGFAHEEQARPKASEGPNPPHA